MEWQAEFICALAGLNKTDAEKTSSFIEKVTAEIASRVNVANSQFALAA